MVFEVAHSSWAIDLHAKRKRYGQAGVIEYVVLCLQPRQLRWFDLARAIEYEPDEAGTLRSQVFPGLWLNCGTVLAVDKYQQAMDLVAQGLASSEHQDFIDRLSSGKRS
jgi:hypothetical protein